MTILGDAFINLRPEASGFGKEAEGALTKTLGGIGLGIGGLAVAGVGLIGTIFKIGTSFEDAFNTIQRQTGATGATLTGLEGTTRKVFASSASSLKDVTAALDEVFVRTGLTGTALQTFTKQEVDLARITGTDVATTVQTTTALLNKMGVAANQQGPALDVLFKAAQQGGKGIDSLAADLTKTSPILSAFGLNVGQQAAIVALLEKSGARVQSVTTGLAKVFQEAAKKGEDPLKLFTSLTDQIRKAGTFTEATSIAVQAFGTRAGPELARALRQGNFDVTALFNSITNGKGGIEATSNATLTLGDKFKILKNTVVNALEPIGMKFVDWAQNQIPKVTFAINVAGAAWDTGLKGAIDRSNIWTTVISGAGAAVRGLQLGWDNMAVPKNAPAIERFFADVGHFFKDELPIDLQAAGATWDHWVERFHSGATRVKGDLGDIVHVLSPSFLINPIAHIGVKGGVPTLTPAQARANLDAEERARGIAVGGINASLAPQLLGASKATADAVNAQLGHGSPMLTEQQKISLYLKAINDWLHNNGPSPFGAAPPATNAQGANRLAQIASQGQAAKLAHLS